MYKSLTIPQTFNVSISILKVVVYVQQTKLLFTSQTYTVHKFSFQVIVKVIDDSKIRTIGKGFERER